MANALESKVILRPTQAQAQAGQAQQQLFQCMDKVEQLSFSGCSEFLLGAIYLRGIIQVSNASRLRFLIFLKV